MKVKELLEKLIEYNPNANVEIRVNGRPQEFKICYGGLGNCTKLSWDCVAFMVGTDCNEEDREMNIDFAKQYILENYFDGDDNVRGVDGDEEIMAMKLAVEALEKQIPKKVTFGYDEQDDILCPTCEFPLANVDDHEYESNFYNYCPHCGVKLDWE